MLIGQLEIAIVELVLAYDSGNDDGTLASTACLARVGGMLDPDHLPINSLRWHYVIDLVVRGCVAKLTTAMKSSTPETVQ